MSGAKTAVELKEVSVDYITATSHQNGDSSPFVSFARWMVSEEVSRGCAHRAWRATGYHGSIAGAVSFGVSQQGSIVRASSYGAANYWAQLLGLADNVTRLDIQVTVKPVAGTTATLSRHHKELRSAPRSKGKPAQFKVWYGPAGPESCIIGKRVSDRFGRVYDKGLESQEAEYDGCLRYELELHRKLAWNMAQQLDSQELDQQLIIESVNGFMRIRGLALDDWRPLLARSAVSSNPLTGYSRGSPDGRARDVPEVTRALRWLSNSVRPAVKRLIESGRSDEVFAALGISHMSIPVEQIPRETWTEFGRWR